MVKAFYTANRRRILRATVHAAVLSVFLAGIIGCSSLPPITQGDQPRSTYEIIPGTIHYPNDLYFPSRIRVEISLSAENRFTQEQRTLVVQTIRNPQRFPVNFILRYAQNEILVQDTHSIFVRVYQEDSNNPYLQSAKISVQLTNLPIATVLIDLLQIR